MKKNKVDVVPIKATESAVKKPTDAVVVDMSAEAVTVDKPTDAVVVDMPAEAVTVEKPIEVVIAVEMPAEMIQVERRGNWKDSLAKFFAWLNSTDRGRRQKTGKPFYNGVSPV